MQAVILAGGLGTRLKTVINDRPKPMAPVLDKPFLEYQINYLKKYDVREVVLCVGYMWEKIRDHFKDGKERGIRIHYAVEETPLGTGGALKNAEEFIHTPFLMLNGDSFFNLNIKDLRNFHEQAKSGKEHFLGTIALTRVADRSQYGTVLLGAGAAIAAFKEKSAGENVPGLINAGIYLLEPDIFMRIPPRQKLSLEREIFPPLLAKGFSLAGYPAEGFFVDIGTPEGFHTFKQYAKEEHL